jgi:hypothetical protein
MPLERSITCSASTEMCARIRPCVVRMGVRITAFAGAAVGRSTSSAAVDIELKGAGWSALRKN